MTKAIRWGFLGAGFIASRAMAPAVHSSDGAVLQAVAARDLARAAELEPQRACVEYREVIESHDVDAVYISLTNEVHEEWVLAAIEAGKPVLCEKPLSTSSESVARILAASGSSTVVEALWYRWHPRYARTMRLLADGAIGEITTIDSRFCFGGVPAGNYRLETARGGGAVLDVGPYAMDAAVSAATAAMHAEPSTELVDHSIRNSAGSGGVDLTLDAEVRLSGALAHVVVSIDGPAEQRFEVIGTEGSIVWPGPEVFTVWHRPSELRLRCGEDDVVEKFASVDPYRLMIEQMGRVIVGDEAPLMTLPESLRLARLLDLLRGGAD